MNVTENYVGTFDSKLGTFCSFDVAEDGVVRCLPSASLDVLYSDANCTNKIAYYVPSDQVDGSESCFEKPEAFPAPSARFAYAFVTDANTCKGRRIQILRVAGEVARPAKLYYQNTNGPCSESRLFIPESAKFYQQFVVEPATIFAKAATLKIEQMVGK